MDLETYRTVMRYEGEVNPDEKADKKNKGFDNATIAFRKDLAKGKVVWVNNAKQDFRYYFKNNHSLFSICLAPKLHPFSRRERFVVFLMQLTLNAGFALCIAYLKNVNDVHPTDSCTSGFKCTFYRFMSMFFGLITSIVTMLLTICATCGCVQTSGRKLRGFCEFFGHFMMFFCALFILVWFALWLVYSITGNYSANFFLAFATTCIYSWSWEILILCLTFCWYRRGERKRVIAEEEKAIKAAIDGKKKKKKCFFVTFKSYERMKCAMPNYGEQVNPIGVVQQPVVIQMQAQQPVQIRPQQPMYPGGVNQQGIIVVYKN